MSDAFIASPSVRREAGRRGIDLAELAQRLGRTTIAREDLHADPARKGATAPGAVDPWDVDHGAYGSVSTEPLSRFERVAVARLSQAQAHIPSVTHHDDADMTAIAEFRARLAEDPAAPRIGELPFVLRALARALTAMPRFNASLTSDGKAVVVKRYVHLGIAVDTAHGLAVPVIRDADRRGVADLAAEIARLAALARDRSLPPSDIGGASMSVSNLGRDGGQGFSPIVNPPEVAILGLGRSEVRPVWHSGAVVPRRMVTLSLSYDHRVINGADAAAFLARLRRDLGDPKRLML